ncbi:MAG: hypothetical protein AB8D78_05510 [Akkermansiaceae bacterium]
MSVLVTAFGPFGDRTENISSIVLRNLREELPEIRTRIFPVDSVIAPSGLKQAIRRIQPSAIVMLGESAACDCIQLESTAWNEKSFGIPDIRGRQPFGEPIRSQSPSSLFSTLPLQNIRQKLASHGHLSAISHDPGRYLCNQIFFTALDFLGSENSHIPAGFIHLPLENRVPADQTTKAIHAVLETLH